MLKPIKNLTTQFSKMPTIGSRTAERLAYYIAKTSPNEIHKLIDAINAVKKTIQYCSVCYNISDDKTCNICKDNKRNKNLICVVEQPQNIIAIEKTKTYNGLYHVLLGTLSPLDGIGPGDIKIGELVKRLKDAGGQTLKTGRSDTNITEVIIATNPTANGEATAVYLTKTIKQLNIKVSRIGFGMAIGSDVSFVDKSTLLRSFENRNQL